MPSAARPIETRIEITTRKRLHSAQLAGGRRSTFSFFSSPCLTVPLSCIGQITRRTHFPTSGHPNGTKRRHRRCTARKTWHLAKSLVSICTFLPLRIKTVIRLCKRNDMFFKHIHLNNSAQRDRYRTGANRTAPLFVNFSLRDKRRPCCWHIVLKRVKRLFSASVINSRCESGDENDWYTG